MDSKLYRGKLRYLVQWKGYPARHEWTWEPVDNLTHSPEAKQTSIGSILLLLDPFNLTTLHFYREITNLSNQPDRRHIGWKGRYNLMHGILFDWLLPTARQRPQLATTWSQSGKLRLRRTGPGTNHQTVTGMLRSQTMDGNQ